MKRDIFVKKVLYLSVVFCSLLTISNIFTTYAETSSVVGFYINENKPQQSLELNPDGTLYMQGDTDAFTGRYKAAGNVVTLDFFGIAQKGEIRGNILIIDNETLRKIKRSKESWKFVANSSADDAHYIDTESIVSLSAGVFRYSRLIFPAKTSKYYTNLEAVRYFTGLQEIDCANNMIRRLKFSLFDKDGNLKRERKEGDDLNKWWNIGSGTVDEKFKNNVCLR